MNEYEIEVQVSVLTSYSDGSVIEQYLHRYHPAADWIPSMFILKCGTKECSHSEETQEFAQAQILYLAHALEHARDEIAAIHRRISNGTHHHHS